MQTRRYERVNFPCKLELKSLPHGAPQPAHSTDLSLGGVGAVVNASLPIDRLTAVTFFFNDPAHGEVKVHTLGRVVHLDAAEDTNKVDIQFLDPLNEVEHPWLVSKLASL